RPVSGRRGQKPAHASSGPAQADGPQPATRKGRHLPVSVGRVSRMQTVDGAAVDGAAAARVLEALRRNGLRDVRADDTTRDVYSSDASLFRVRPAAVAFPHDVDEVLAVLAACREAGVPLTSRGAGTSIAGNAVGPGVVLEF